MADPPPRKQRRRRRLLRAGGRVFAVLGLLIVSGITVQAQAEQAERDLYPPQGYLVDAGGGQHIHVRDWGSREAPGPTIVLDASASMPLTEWAWVGRGLAELGHHVVAYDRPGMGWSRGPWQPRDSKHAADGLAAALAEANIPPPYVVVGHSFGGFSARVFAGANRDDVAALVLLDTTHPDGGGELAFATWYRIRAWQGHAGLFELFPPGNGFWELPAEEQAAAHAVSQWTSHLDTTAEELEAWPSSAAQVRAADVRAMPLLVVSAVGSDAHLALQRDLLRLSAESRFVQLNVSHIGMLLDRDQAQQTIATIEEFVREL